MSKLIWFLVLDAFVRSSARIPDEVHFLGKPYIDSINSAQISWKAGENFSPKTSLKNILGLLGSKGVRTNVFKKSDILDTSNDQVPKEFDARNYWKNCKSIGTVRDQGNCGSCWAFSTVGAFADRMCIATSGKFNQMLSVEELTFCCYRCGYGCQGGYPIRAWSYFKSHGVVTGGDYESNEGCQPYKVQPCGKNNTCTESTETNHECSRKCYGDNTINYRNDHRKTRNAYYLDYEEIQTDLMEFGSTEASFEVYDDFLSYKSGVYTKTRGAKYLGGHSVKCIGWGVENDVPYWLMVNSWNDSWGDGGMFKIRRGTNECEVDGSFTAGEPRV